MCRFNSASMVKTYWRLLLCQWTSSDCLEDGCRRLVESSNFHLQAQVSPQISKPTATPDQEEFHQLWIIVACPKNPQNRGGRTSGFPLWRECSRNKSLACSCWLHTKLMHRYPVTIYLTQIQNFIVPKTFARIFSTVVTHKRYLIVWIVPEYIQCMRMYD